MTRLDDLLADRALFGLDDDERAELDALLSQHPDVEPESLELAAAALHLAVLDDDLDTELPPQIRRRIHGEATAYFSEPVTREGPMAVELHATPAGKGPHPLVAWGGWLAAAAALVLAALAWMGGEPVQPSPEAALAALEKEAPDLVEVRWSGVGPTPEASGSVVWSPSRQEGYMIIRDLPANDPTQAQYQLWVFDAARPETHPVDGGVFDVPPGVSELVVPIDAKLKVFEAAAFAVTVEKPGGVVQSARDPVVLLGAVG